MRQMRAGMPFTNHHAGNKRRRGESTKRGKLYRVWTLRGRVSYRFRAPFRIPAGEGTPVQIQRLPHSRTDDAHV